jgi:N-methylhydantoinase A
MATRIGVDVGGTFTDVIFYDDSTGAVRIGKVPTVPSDPEEGVIAGLRAALTPRDISGSQYFIHGTTVGLNALLERKGPVIGLLATNGFRDILEIRRTDREDPYELLPPPVEPLVPRWLRLPVRERIVANGDAHTPIELDDVREAYRVFAEAGVTVVAVAFLNSYVNPEHELAAEDALREAGFQGDIALSHQISGEYREYERTSTTVIDAFIRTRIRTYLEELEKELGRLGLHGDLLIGRPDGGAVTFEEAASHPIDTVLSGPVGGVQGSAELARTLGLDEVITADVGGTSFDTAVITDARPHLMYEGKIAGQPVQTAWVDVRSIGAGGGSVAHVDPGGMLKVGPRSAGSNPGPACYGRGGLEPTATDAAAYLGLLPAELASALVLDVGRAEAALAALGDLLALTPDRVAQGIMLIASAAMAGAMREITIEQGRDPRSATLFAFGGAGPLFATLLARDLEMQQIVIPPYAGNFSAWGMLGADLVRVATRSRVLALSPHGIDTVNETLAALFERLEHRVGDAGASTREVHMDMRYVGQEHTITVPVPAANGVITTTSAAIAAIFTETYRSTFSYTLDADPEFVTTRATLRERLPRRREEAVVTTEAVGGGSLGTQRAFSFADEEWLDFDVLRRDSLVPGVAVPGPVIVLEETSTTVVDTDFQARVGESNALFLTRR